jgi:hypothetical protein
MSSDLEQKREELTRRILDKVVSDPQFREAIVANPQTAISNSDFAQEIKELVNSASADVSGYAAATPLTLDSWSICL